MNNGHALSVARKAGGGKLRSIDHALEVLNDAARDSSDEIKHMVSKDYRKLKSVFNDVKPEIAESFREIRDTGIQSISSMKDRVVDTTREKAQAVDAAVHERPWTFLGGAALAACVLGFIAGRRSKS